MIAQGLEKLSELLKQGHSPTRLSTSDKDVERFEIGGEIVEYAAPRSDRGHRVFTLADLCATIEKFKGISPVAWVSDRKVTAVFDDDLHGRNQCHLDLDLHPIVAALLDNNLCGLEHRTFVDKLRDVSDGVDFNPSDFVKQMRVMKFKTTDESNSTRNPTGDGMDRSLRAEASGVEELPEEITLIVAVMPNDFEGAEQTLRCLVQVDAEDQLVSLKLPETETVRLQRAIRNKVCEYIEENSTASAFEGSK